MDTRPLTLATIGYEGADLSDFVATLHQAEIRRVIDVRQLAGSRRKGFSKRALSCALVSAGIDYVHLRGLGDPKPGREAARAGDHARFTRIFTSHMQTEAAQADLKIAERLVAEGGACLMCYERDHSACHRTFVASAVSASLPASIRHLGVRPGLEQRNAVTGAAASRA